MQSFIIELSKITYCFMCVCCMFITFIPIITYIPKYISQSSSMYYIYIMSIMFIAIIKFLVNYYPSIIYKYINFERYLYLSMSILTIIYGIICINLCDYKNGLFLISIAILSANNNLIPSELIQFYKKQELDIKIAKKKVISRWNTQGKKLNKLYHHSQNRTITESMMDNAQKFKEIESEITKNGWSYSNSKEMKYIKNNLGKISFKLLILSIIINIYSHLCPYFESSLYKQSFFYIYLISCSFIFYGHLFCTRFLFIFIIMFIIHYIETDLSKEDSKHIDLLIYFYFTVNHFMNLISNENILQNNNKNKKNNIYIFLRLSIIIYTFANCYSFWFYPIEINIEQEKDNYLYNLLKIIEFIVCIIWLTREFQKKSLKFCEEELKQNSPQQRIPLRQSNYKKGLAIHQTYNKLICVIKTGIYMVLLTKVLIYLHHASKAKIPIYVELYLKHTYIYHLLMYKFLQICKEVVQKFLMILTNSATSTQEIQEYIPSFTYGYDMEYNIQNCKIYF